MQVALLPTRVAQPELSGVAIAREATAPIWLARPHVLFAVTANALWQATRILGDEFSAMGVAVALGMPRPMVAQGLALMAEGNWIARIPAGASRHEKHGPWYEPRSKWEQLRTAKSGVASS